MKISNAIIKLWILASTIVGCLPACTMGQAAGGKAGLPLYIDNVHIIDVSAGAVVEQRQLLIRNGKIAAINPAKAPITDEHFIHHDGKGQYVMPGLIDMHVHAYDPAAFTITLSHGVTHLRLMNGVKQHLHW